VDDGSKSHSEASAGGTEVAVTREFPDSCGKASHFDDVTHTE